MVGLDCVFKNNVSAVFLPGDSTELSPVLPYMTTVVVKSSSLALGDSCWKVSSWEWSGKK